MAPRRLNIVVDDYVSTDGHYRDGYCYLSFFLDSFVHRTASLLGPLPDVPTLCEFLTRNRDNTAPGGFCVTIRLPPHGDFRGHFLAHVTPVLDEHSLLSPLEILGLLPPNTLVGADEVHASPAVPAVVAPALTRLPVFSDPLVRRFLVKVHTVKFKANPEGVIINPFTATAVASWAQHFRVLHVTSCVIRVLPGPSAPVCHLFAEYAWHGSDETAPTAASAVTFPSYDILSMAASAPGGVPTPSALPCSFVNMGRRIKPDPDYFGYPKLWFRSTTSPLTATAADDTDAFTVWAELVLTADPSYSW